MAIKSDSNLETEVTLNFPPFAHPSEGTDVLNPSEKIIIQLQHIKMTPSGQKPVPCPISLHNNVSHTSSTCNLANVHHMVVVFITDRFPENVPPHTLDRPNNRNRKWISSRRVCVSLHHFSSHVNCSRTWLNPPPPPDHPLSTRWRGITWPACLYHYRVLANEKKMACLDNAQVFVSARVVLTLASCMY